MAARHLHVYNRGLDKRIIFPSDLYYQRFLTTSILSRLSRAPRSTIYFKQEKLGRLPVSEQAMFTEWGPASVDILAYCLMSNHFHFLLQEKEDNGVAKFMQRLGNGYTKYFNAKEKREGRLFTSTYKQVEIKTDEQLLHVSKYIHLNPVKSSFTNVSMSKLLDYPWSSLRGYINKKENLLCQPQEILKFFTTTNYWDFVYEGTERSLLMFSKEIFLDIEVE